MKVFAGGGELFGGGVLEVPELVFHPVVELVRILLTLKVELAAYRSILKREGGERERWMEDCFTVLLGTITRTIC